MQRHAPYECTCGFTAGTKQAMDWHVRREVSRAGEHCIHQCVISPTQSPLDGGRSVRHLADDSLSNDEASLQSGVGGGGDTDVGDMQLDSNSGYVCTLDFPNLTRYHIRDACGLKPGSQHGEWSCPYKCGKMSANLRSINSHLVSCIGPGHGADLYCQCVSVAVNADQLLRFNVNLKAVKQWSLGTSMTSTQGHHSPVAQSARVAGPYNVPTRREGGRGGSGAREGAIALGGAGASSARSTGVYYHTRPLFKFC